MPKPKFSLSSRRHKKYSVITPNGNTVHFGDKRYEHYKDSTGIGAYSHMDHNDTTRRDS